MSDAFDDALAQAIASDDHRAVVNLCDTGMSIAPRVLFAGVAAGSLEIVEVLIANGAEVTACDAHGITALHVAAAAGSPLLARLVRAPLEVDFAAIGDGPERGHVRSIARLLCDRGAELDARAGTAGLVPLGLARFFAQHAVADLLLARGADPTRRDSLGRVPDHLAVFPAIGRAIRICRQLPMVRAAHMTQVHAPATHQFTSPALALDLSGPLPADAFAGWPPDASLVVFGLGDDAISRLVRLTPAVYVAPGPTSGRAVAAEIASALDASVRDAPSRDHTHQFAIVLADGRVPVLVRDFGHALGITVGDHRSWSMLATAKCATTISDVAATARQWAGTPANADAATLLDIALVLVDACAAETGERWTIGIPGTPEPREIWLHGATHDAAAVGVVAAATRILVAGAIRATPIASRADLPTVARQVVSQVRAQLASYARNLALGEQVRTVAAALCERLAMRFPERAFATTVHGFSSHERAVTVRLDGDGREVAVVAPAGETVRVYAGIRGCVEFDVDVTGLEPMFDELADAVEQTLAALTGA